MFRDLQLCTSVCGSIVSVCTRNGGFSQPLLRVFTVSSFRDAHKKTLVCDLFGLHVPKTGLINAKLFVCCRVDIVVYRAKFHRVPTSLQMRFRKTRSCRTRIGENIFWGALVWVCGVVVVVSKFVRVVWV